VLDLSNCTGNRVWPTGLAAALRSATVLQPGIEPGPRPSQGRVMSVSPSKQQQWTVEGVEPSFAGCKPTVFPLDDTPIHRTSGPGGDRTHIALFKRQVLSQLSYKAVSVSGRS
jgi:hypothetical protein